MSQGAALQIQGSRESGQDVRGQNVTAVAAIANIVKSSLGPVGLDKVDPRTNMALFSGHIAACSAYSAFGRADACRRHR